VQLLHLLGNQHTAAAAEAGPLAFIPQIVESLPVPVAASPQQIPALTHVSKTGHQKAITRCYSEVRGATCLVFIALTHTDTCTPVATLIVVPDHLS
jgi:hypothetical protein